MNYLKSFVAVLFILSIASMTGCASTEQVSSSAPKGEQEFTVGSNIGHRKPIVADNLQTVDPDALRQTMSTALPPPDPAGLKR
jgi:hypothetical protein